MKLLKLLLLLTIFTLVSANNNNSWQDAINKFTFAAEYGDIESINNYLKKSPNIINCQRSSFEKKTALHYATINGHLEIVKILINAGADVNVRDYLRDTPIYPALRNSNEFNEENKNNIEIVKLLLKSGAYIEVRDCVGTNPLSFALIHDAPIEIVNLLINNNTVNSRCLLYKRCPIHWSINRGPFFVKTLIKAGANLNMQDCDQNSPLHLVGLYVYRKSIEPNIATETLKLLLDADIDLTLKNNQDKTALDIFKENNWVEGIKIIEEHIKAKK